jgi:hypothetical protein
LLYAPLTSYVDGLFVVPEVQVIFPLESVLEVHPSGQVFEIGGNVVVVPTFVSIKLRAVKANINRIIAIINTIV